MNPDTTPQTDEDVDPVHDPVTDLAATDPVTPPESPTETPYQRAKRKMAEAADASHAEAANGTDLDDPLTPEQREVYDGLTEAAAAALGEPHGAQAIAAQIITATAAAAADGGPSMDEAWQEIKKGFEKCADEVARIEVGGIAYTLATALNLTGRRRTVAVEAITSTIATVQMTMGEITDAVSLLEIAGIIQGSPRWYELLGALYIPAAGETFKPDPSISFAERRNAWRDHFAEVGETIDETMTIERVAGVLRRFFSLSDSGMQGLLKRYLARFLSRFAKLNIAPESESGSDKKP